MAHIRTRPKLATLYLLLVGVFILAAYELSFPLLFFRLNLWPMAVLTAMAAAAFGTGLGVVRLLARCGARRGELREPAQRSPVRVSYFPIAEEITLSLAVGLGIVAYGVLALGLLHLLRRWVVVPVFALAVVFGLFQAYRYWKAVKVHGAGRRGRRTKRPRWKLPPVFRTGVLICLFAPLGLSFLLALMPVHQSDAIRYHLAAPALYVDAGGLVGLPHSAFSNFPFTIEMLFTLALVLGAESAAKLVHWLFLVLLVASVYGLGRHIRMRSLGLLSAAVLANVPFIPIFASWAFIEVGLSLYTFLIFFCLVRLLRCLAGSEAWGEAERPPDPSRRVRFRLHPSAWVVLCGVFSGFALGTKYTSLFPFGLAVVTLVIVRLRELLRERKKQGAAEAEKTGTRLQPLPHAGRQMAVLVGIAVLIGSPWYLKNLVLTGNPVYPFGGSVLPTPHWTAYNAAFYRYHAGLKGELNEFRRRDPIEKTWDLITLPYTLTVGRRIEDDLTYFAGCRPSRLWPWDREDGMRGGVYAFLESGDQGLLRPIDFGRWEAGPLWLLLLPLLLGVRRRPWEVRLLLGYGGLLFLFWAFTYRDNRFLIPAFAVLAVPAGYALLAFSRTKPAIHAGFRVFFLAVLWWNLLWLMRSAFTAYNPFPVITGRVSVPDFLGEQRDTGSFIRAVREANRIRTAGEKILFVGEYRPYHCRPPYVCADWFNTPVLIEWIREAQSLDGLRERLRAEGVEFVLVHQGEIDKYWIYYLPHFLRIEKACAWLERYERAATAEEQGAAVDGLLAAARASPVWGIYRDFIMSPDTLEAVYEEPYVEEEKGSRPPLPARSRIGVYRVR